MTVNLSDDPRWQRLHDNSWICPCCGESHGGLFDLAAQKPDSWNDSFDQTARSEGRFPMYKLTSDLCVVEGEYFFVRGVVKIPIVGAPCSYFGWGAWSSLSNTSVRLKIE